MDEGVAFGQVDLEGGETFQAVRRSLGVTTFGINVITLNPRERLRIHRHHRQEEVYLVLAGTLTLSIEAEEHELAVGGVARVAPAVRRQLTNRGRYYLRRPSARWIGVPRGPRRRGLRQLGRRNRQTSTRDPAAARPTRLSGLPLTIPFDGDSTARSAFAPLQALGLGSPSTHFA